MFVCHSVRERVCIFFNYDKCCQTIKWLRRLSHITDRKRVGGREKERVYRCECMQKKIENRICVTIAIDANDLYASFETAQTLPPPPQVMTPRLRHLHVRDKREFYTHDNDTFDDAEFACARQQRRRKRAVAAGHKHLLEQQQQNTHTNANRHSFTNTNSHLFRMQWNNLITKSINNGALTINLHKYIQTYIVCMYEKNH